MLRYSSNADVVTTRLESRSTKLQLLVNVGHFTRNDKMLGLKLSRDHTQYTATQMCHNWQANAMPNCTLNISTGNYPNTTAEPMTSEIR